MDNDESAKDLTETEFTGYVKSSQIDQQDKDVRVIAMMMMTDDDDIPRHSGAVPQAGEPDCTQTGLHGGGQGGGTQLAGRQGLQDGRHGLQRLLGGHGPQQDVLQRGGGGGRGQQQTVGQGSGHG